MPCGKRCLVIYSGGSIGMILNESGVYAASAPNMFIEKISKSPDLCEWCDLEKGHFMTKINNNIINYTIVEYEPLLDSSNMTPNEWIRIAKDIEENYSKYDAFIVLHGTDTLAFTASALSFMLEGLTKPVILTGALVSIFESRNDAKDNILSSLFFASIHNVPEVCVCFGHRLFRGNRTAKYSANLFSAFTSPNYHHIGRDGIKFSLFKQYVSNFENPTSCFKVFTDLNPNVSVIIVHPAIQLRDFEALLSPPTDGAVMQCYGAGNICSNRTDVMDVLKKAVCRGVIIINTTQCFQGAISPTYETGKILFDIGVIPGYDLTLPAAVTKLSYVLGHKDWSVDKKKEVMRTNIRGELQDDYSHEL